MKSTQTLCLKKQVDPAQNAHKPRPERSLIGKDVIIQTKSPARITGRISSFENGWIVITGTEHRWLSDGTMSAPVTSGEFSMDRSNVTYIVEVM